MLVLMVMAAWAEVPAFMTVGAGTAPDGISTQWFLAECNVRVRVTNATATPVEVDWNRSVYAPEGAGAVGLVSGSASKQSSMLGMTPMVVPAGAFAEEMLFRKDRMDDENRCLIDATGKATVTLSISGDWATQVLEFRPDLEQAKMLAEEREAKRQAGLKAHQLAEIRSRPVLDFRAGQVCVQHEQRGDADPCYSNHSPKNTKVAVAAIGGNMRAFGCTEDSIELVTDAIRRGATTAPLASRTCRACVLGMEE